MKHVRLFVFLLGLMLVLAACGSSAPAPAAEAPEAAAVNPTNTAVPPTGTPVRTYPGSAPCCSNSKPTGTPIPPPTDTPAPAAAPAAEKPVPAKPLSRVIVPAPSLAGNMIGDPAEREVAVYVPPSYNESDKSYPVVYFLTGYDEGLDASYMLSAAMKNLLEAGTVNEMILVIASGQNALGGSFYVNSPLMGNWEDFVVNDLVPYIDENYRTVTGAHARGIAGFSMGGFGALNLAMRYPQVFGAVYALSPGLFAPEGLAQSQMFANKIEIEGFLKMQNELAELSPEEAGASFVKRANQGSNLRFAVAYGVAFAPNPDRGAPYLDYPYAEPDGEPDPEVWAKWESGYGGTREKVQMYKDNLLNLKGILVDYGIHDQYKWIPEGVEYFAEQLEAEGIPHQVESFEGGHGPVSARAETVMLPFFSRLLAAEARTSS